MTGLIPSAITAVGAILIYSLARYYRRALRLRRERTLAHERARIARDIHDDLGNGLAGIAMLSDLAKGDVGQDTIHKRLDQIYDLAQSLARSVDEIVWAVNPENDSWAAFVSYFEQYTAHFLDAARLNFQVILPQHINLSASIPAAVRHHLVLAVREAITNVLKHASARNIKVELMPLPRGGLAVSVHDDGHGFDTAQQQATGHDGLHNMRKRMDEVGGTCTIHSDAHGTHVRLNIPKVNNT